MKNLATWLLAAAFTTAALPAFAVEPSVQVGGNNSNLLIVFYVQIMPDDFVMQLHRF